jgi:hypothetical protein
MGSYQKQNLHIFIFFFYEKIDKEYYKIIISTATELFGFIGCGLLVGGFFIYIRDLRHGCYESLQ